MKSDVQSERRLSRNRRGVTQSHQKPPRCEREVGEGKLRGRKALKSEKEGSDWRVRFNLTESQKTNSFLISDIFPPELCIFLLSVGSLATLIVMNMFSCCVDTFLHRVSEKLKGGN